MAFLDKLLAGSTTLSCEFFPPKNPDQWSTLYQSMGRMARLGPDFFSVTYGAGGSTREKTVDLVHRIEKELGIEAVAHLTCVGHTKEELTAILALLKKHGVHSIMALRGDAPTGSETFEAHPDGFAHACDLISLAHSDPNLKIGCAFYPDKHLEARTLLDDIDYLKLKQDCGANFAVSQVFFDNDSYYRYRDLASARGINLPLIAGILPATSKSQVTRIAAMCGAIIPGGLRRIIDTSVDDNIRDTGIDYAVQQSGDLLRNGVAGIHLYTFNLATSSVKVIKDLRGMGYFSLPQKALAETGVA